MEERKVYLPKQYFIFTTIILSFITIFIAFITMLEKSFTDVLTLSYISIVSLVGIIFSYFSYKGKIPYMYYIGNKAYASVFQLYAILIISILTTVYLLILYNFGEGISPEERKIFPYVMTFIISIFILSTLYIYLSYKRKIPLFKME